MSEIEDEVMIEVTNDSNNCKRSSEFDNHCLSDGTDCQDYIAVLNNLETLAKLVLSAPDNDQERVESIKNDISSGSYQITSEHIAKQMLSHMNQKS